MLRSLRCPCRRLLRRRRSLLYPAFLFLISTFLLYILIEHTIDLQSSPSTTLPIPSSTSICQINNETQRAIHLASTQFCKEQLTQVSCEIHSNNTFFSRSLPRYCPLTKGHFGDVIGCLPVKTGTNEITFNMTTSCIDYCLKYSVSYAEYNPFTGQCLCSSTSENQTDWISTDPKCSQILPTRQRFVDQFRVVYRTGYNEFGNHLEKNRSKTSQNPLVIVFFLTVGDRRNFRQIQRLIRSIYSRQHYYLIHVDSRENYLHNQLMKFSQHFMNIRLTRQRFPTIWGSPTLLNAHFAAFEEIFNELKWNFSFILNLSESDFPLKPVLVLSNFLSMYPSYNFLRTHNRDPFKFFRSQGMFYTFFQCENYIYRIGSRSLIENIIYDGGSDWYVLNREFVHYITFGNDDLVNGLRKMFHYSLLPCETFFHTLLSNSHYCDSYIRNNFRLVHWNRERGCKCQHKNVVDWCGCSPLIYRSEDKRLLNETIDKPLFFARKFDPTIDEEIIDWLEENILRRNASTRTFYLQNIYHIDERKQLDTAVKFFDAYIRTRLIESEPSDRNCFNEVTYQLEQIHSIYMKSIFQGYLFEYKFSNGEQHEIFLKMNYLQSNRSASIKRFEVGITLDIKENVFIDRSRTFLEPNLIKVLIEWSSLTINNDTALVIQNPIGVSLQRIQLNPSNLLLLVDIKFPVVYSPNMIGIWQISLVQHQTDSVLAWLNFLLLPNNENQWLNVHYLAILTNFWSISNICSTQTTTLKCNFALNQTNCYEQRWSSFFLDM